MGRWEDGKMGGWENGRSELTQVMCFGKGVRGAFNGKEMRVSDFRLKNSELIKNHPEILIDKRKFTEDLVERIQFPKRATSEIRKVEKEA